MGKTIRESLVRYGLAAATVALIMLSKASTDSLFGGGPLILFLTAVMFTARFAGPGPGVAATVLSALACDYFYFPPVGTLAIHSTNDAFRLTVFVLEGLTLSGLMGSLQAARGRAEASRRLSLDHEVTLRRSEEQFRTLVEGVRDYALIMLDPAGRIASWNPGAERIKGYRAGEILGEHFSRFYPPGDLLAGKPGRELAEAEATGRYEEEGWRLRKDGSRFWASVTIAAVRDEAGGLRGFSKVTRDITERKQAGDALSEAKAALEDRVSELDRANERLRSELVERGRVEGELQASEKRFRTLSASSPIGIFQTDAEGLCIYANDRCAAICGVDSPESLLGHGWAKTLHPDDRGAVLAEWEVAAHECREYSREYRLVAPGEEVRCAHVRTAVIRGDGGEPVGHVGTLEDISARKRAEESFRRQAAALQEQSDLLDLAHDMILVRDLDGTILSWNRGAEASYGWAKEEAVGRRSHDLLRAEFPGILEEIDAELRREGRWQGELTHTARGGTRLVVASRWVQQPAEDGRTAKVLEINTDVTARKRAEAAMLQAREAAEEASRAKSEFLANMSHEIRTPMNGVLGMLDLTLRSELAPRHREFLGMAKASAETLLRLLNEILDFSKIEAGWLELESTPFGLRETLGAVIQAQAVQVQEKGLELTCWVATDVPDALVGDPGRLSQVLVNLVGNAKKFTERGEIAVRVEREPQDAEGVCLRIAVLDTGIGIPPEKQEHIFAAFAQADGSMTRQYGGTGLGLAISARLVEAMGGRLRVESRLGHGSTFRFTARFGVHDEEVIRPAPRGLNLTGLPVLVVDDNATNRQILGELLAHWGMRPTVVDGGRAALAVIQQACDAGEPFPLVLLDAMMPGMDGFAVAKQIQRDPALAGTAIMMLSSADLRGDVERCRALGIAVHLRKPVTESDLLDSMLRVLGVVPVTRAESSSPAPDTLPPPSQRCRILLAEDTPVNQRLAVALLEDRGHEVVVAGDGREALEILDREAFDLILMDVQMPRMDGFQATAAIRQREAGTGRHIPVIAMTAHAMKGDRERCLAAGMDGYISKPIRPEQFLAVVEGRALPADGAPPDGGAKGVGATVFDPEGALARVRGKRPLLQKMAALFLADCPGLLAQVRAALAAGDGRMLERAAHRLKGAAANLSAARVVAAAGCLEEMAREGHLAEADAACAELEVEVIHLGHALEILEEEGAVCGP